jgi:hypothetical protein
MVGVVVAEEDLAKGEADSVSHHLTLVPFATVEQERLALALHRQAGHVPVDRGGSRAGSEEGDAEHGGKIQRKREPQKT